VGQAHLRCQLGRGRQPLRGARVGGEGHEPQKAKLDRLQERHHVRAAQAAPEPRVGDGAVPGRRDTACRERRAPALSRRWGGGRYLPAQRNTNSSRATGP